MNDATLCHECCSPYVRQARPEVVRLDASGTCPNCGRWYASRASGLIPAGTLVEVRTENGGAVQARTWSSTQVLGAGEGLAPCGAVDLADASGAFHFSIGAHRIVGFRVLEAAPRG